jgi:phenylalanyl-tRNA synthetase beta chain
VEAVLRITGREHDFRFERAAHPALHPERCARILAHGAPAGWLGALHPRLLRALDLPVAVYVFELSADAALAARVPEFRPLSAFPALRRDLAVIVDEGVAAQALLDAASAAAPAYLRAVHIFDVYRGKGVESGRKSVALGLIFQEYSRTLTDADADGAVASVRTRLEQAFNARLRD